MDNKKNTVSNAIVKAFLETSGITQQFYYSPTVMNYLQKYLSDYIEINSKKDYEALEISSHTPGIEIESVYTIKTKNLDIYTDFTENKIWLCIDSPSFYNDKSLKRILKGKYEDKTFITQSTNILFDENGQPHVFKADAHWLKTENEEDISINYSGFYHYNLTEEGELINGQQIDDEATIPIDTKDLSKYSEDFVDNARYLIEEKLDKYISPSDSFYYDSIKNLKTNNIEQPTDTEQTQ